VVDGDLAVALTQARDIEAAARASLETDDLVERDAAVIVLRHTVALRRALEQWIGDRLVRAHRRAAVGG
jgi:hypothetical protein